MTLLGIVLAIVVIAIFWRVFAGLALIVVALCIVAGVCVGLSDKAPAHVQHTKGRP